MLLTAFCLLPAGCGPEGIRTPGLLSAIEARSQLRYRPILGRTVFYLSEVGMSRKHPKRIIHPFVIGLRRSADSSFHSSFNLFVKKHCAHAWVNFTFRVAPGSPGCGLSIDRGPMVLIDIPPRRLEVQPGSQNLVPWRKEK